jgi:hypothetical protein
MTGTIGLTSSRKYKIAGFANTSHGQVSTSISQEQNFSNTQTIDFDVVHAALRDRILQQSADFCECRVSPKG